VKLKSEAKSRISPNRCSRCYGRRLTSKALYETAPMDLKCKKKTTERVYAKQKVKQIRVVALWTDPERLTPNIDTDWPLAWRVTC
jgi:hypothetical protein